MTTTIKVNTNGNYVSTIKINGVEAGTVGPGSMVEKSFGLPHNNGGPSVFEVFERQATPEEIEAAKAAASR
ncbi:hypothetical protein [Mesorhizobium sp. M0968]|uniref:hypothetical protein n=1 Tax=Mesorhizobium sp. M0968 TaxID=2957037 RepID=UPI0033366C29